MLGIIQEGESELNFERVLSDTQND